MAISTYAAIDIGSGELSMKLYEVSKQRGICELTHVRHKFSLGAEIYAKGFISYQTIGEICNTLNDFKRIINEYQTASWQIYATSILREARNLLVIIDQIKVQTGFNVRVLSNSESRFLYYKALALKKGNFESLIEDGTLIVDIDAGSVQLSIFDQGKLCVTQNLLLGSTRIRELLQAMQDEAYDFHALIDEYIEKDLLTFKKLYLDSTKIRHVIAIGEMIPDIYYYMKSNRQKNGKGDFDGILTRKAMSKNKLLKVFAGASTRLAIPTILICRKISQLTDCDEILLSAVDLCDGMAVEYAEKKVKLRLAHNFTEDILSTSENIARKYMVDMKHVENVQTLALQIFDRIRKLHGLGKRERLLLQIAVILHSCGAYINEIQSRECSYRIIMSTEIIGISHKERTIVANMVRYNSSSFPSYEELDEDFTKEEYITIVKLNAILKTANVLDKSNRQKIKNVGVTLEDGILTITADTMADITLEKGLFHQKADVFQEVFGIRPTLKQRRSGGSSGRR
ncbi:MAG: exopolyphosphatase [Lachnospiraceae bacterium]|nr:exopolyphosphatase [Lachnospiraceae bacterium]